MLWLVGFVGLMGVGALSLVDFNTAQDAEDSSETEADLTAQYLLGPDLFAQHNTVDSGPEGTADEDEDTDASDTRTLMAQAEDPAGVEVLEFDPQQHDLVVIWDDAFDAPPPISVAHQAEDSDITEISSDNTPLAHIRCDAETVEANIALMPLSTAQTLGWAEA